jgi:DNA-binding transcriptional ArsR family regulator
MEPVLEEQSLSDATWSLSVMEQNAREAAALLKALAHESRLMILCNLIDAEKTVTQLNQTVPLSQSALSQHLAKLRHQGLVTVRKEAQMVYYRLKSDKVARLLSTLYDIYCR